MTTSIRFHHSILFEVIQWYVFNWHVLFLLTNLLMYLSAFLDLFLFIWLESTHFLLIGALITLPYMTKPSQVTLPNFFLQLNHLNILISATLQWTWLLNSLTFNTIEHSWSYSSTTFTLILSYDSYVLQSLHPYELLTQNIKSSHFLVSLAFKSYSYNPFMFLSTFTKLTFHVLYFSPTFSKAF